MMTKDRHIQVLEETNRMLRNKSSYWQRKYLDVIERARTLGLELTRHSKGEENERKVRGDWN